MKKIRKTKINKKILVMGLPGSGKTTLAKSIYKDLNAKWINADQIRKKYNDWDFSKEGRIRQAKRLNQISNKIKSRSNVVVDFVCPNKDSFKYFKSDFIIWMDTIKQSRKLKITKRKRAGAKEFDSFFKKPKKFNLRITTKDYKKWRIVALDMIQNKKWDNQKATAQMLGRFQPWHNGHKKLFEEILKKDLQVNIMVKDTFGLDKKNPYPFKKIKTKIYKDIKIFKNRIKITKMPNITNIFYGRAVGYNINKILTPKKYRNISSTKIRRKLSKEGKL